jgi:hypothetical protein
MTTYLLAEPVNLVELIDQGFDAMPEEKPRAYIGASIIGDECDAYLAFSLRGYPGTKIQPKLRRIFRDGHRIEVDVIEDLKQAGAQVVEVDPKTGKQWEWKSHGGHFVVHADGVCEQQGETVGLEIKSMNAKKFHEFQRLGVKQSHPRYYAQCQALMGLSGMRKTVLVAYCKDTSVYHVETVEFDEFVFAFQASRVERVLRGDAQKIAADATDWRCRFCFKADACWHGKEPEHSMHSCANAQPVDGGWSCSKGCSKDCEDWTAYQPKTRT